MDSVVRRASDPRRPTTKLSFREALSRRIRRVYGPLLTVLGLAWVLRITHFTPQTRWVDERKDEPEDESK